MKTRLKYAICLVALAIIACPLSANDYLKIYFKDGHTERHYMRLVESISTTKYDLQGNLHSEYQMQQIAMLDTTYSYYLADIDSMTFTKVTEEQLISRVESVQNSLESILQNCSNIEDITSHIDKIKVLDGVENVYSDGKNTVIQIRDWFDIFINHQPKPDNAVSSSRSNKREIMPLLKSTSSKDSSPLKVTLSFQMVDDFNFVESKGLINLLNTKFSVMGYNPTYYLGNELDFDFFYRRIFDSNVLLIDTHGGYGIFNKKHYFFTGVEVDHAWYTIVKFNVFKELGIDVNNVDLDDIGISLCQYDDGGIFDPEIGSKWYWTVKEDFIRKSPYKFTGKGPHIVFVSACSSLQGNDTLTTSDGTNAYGSDSFAQIFFDKGADVYLGYNRGTYRSSNAASSYFNYMIHGASVEQAFKSLYSLLKYEKDKDEKAVLIDLYNRNSNNPKGIFIVNTHTEEKSNQKFNDEFAKAKQVELTGTTFCWKLEDMHPIFGFKVSKKPNINESNYGEEIQTYDYHYTENGNKEVIFSATFIPEPGTTYYYRAFTHDNIHYNWGEEKQFTIYDDLSIAITESIDLEIEGNANVRIMSGSGDYTVDSSAPEVATATIVGEFMTIQALSEGKATIIITDNKTGQTASFTVTVTDPNSTDVSGEFIDLGLPSGTLWASYNIGATQPEEYGEYYAWGETEVKTKYFWSNYIQCNGSKETCYDLGPEISGTSYDAARTKWKGGWQLPTFDQFNELIYNCSYTWTTVNDVTGKMFTGPNGKTIFFPAAGYKANEVSNSGSYGYYWSGTQDPDNIIRAYNLSISEEKPRCLNNYRYAGFTIRPVISGLELSKSNTISMMENKEESIAIKSGSGNYTYEVDNDAIVTVSINKDIVTIKAMNAGDAIITVTDLQNGKIARIIVSVAATPVAVDLGLSVKWASCNVGAKNQEDVGYYYSWGETETKNEYWWSTYKYCNGSSDKLTKYCNNSEYGNDGFTDSLTILDPEDDIAHVKWGGNWRMPTIDEIKELLDNCTWNWTEQNGVEGYIVTSKIKGCEGNSIFIPVTGYRRGDEIKNENYAYYWTSSHYTRSPEYAYNLPFGENSHNWNCGYRYAGCPIRPVESNITQEQ